MKSKINLWLAISFVIATALTVWIYIQLGKRVGDIPLDKNPNSTQLSPCHDHPIYQYYSINTDYVGGKRALKRELKDKIPINNLPDSGLLTVRFIVNCQGNTGVFQSLMIDSSINRVDLSDYDLSPIYSVISKLENWQPGKVKDISEDSYYQISFKLQNGELIDIF